MDLRAKIPKVKPAVVKIISAVPNSSGRYTGSFGSGFIVSRNGVVVTNNHVLLANATINQARFHDGSIKQANVIHTDQTRDFAILQLEQGTYPFLELGDYDTVLEGTELYFCGYPLRSDNHIIHHGGASAKFTENGIRIVQIDGSVNSGNSGGPLLDMEDKVVGIITQKAGGIDERLTGISNFVRSAPTVFTLDYTLSNGQTIKVDPTKELANVIEIIHDYTSVGIGYAFSIEYAKSALLRRNLV